MSCILNYLPLLINYFSSFSPSPDHPDQHSFPTRRSSDLQVAHAEARQQGALRRQPGERQALGFPRRAQRAEIDVRSEEHTSELQSHVNLVCRLLLEKKNKHVCVMKYYTYALGSSMDVTFI